MSTSHLTPEKIENILQNKAYAMTAKGHILKYVATKKDKKNKNVFIFARIEVSFFNSKEEFINFQEYNEDFTYYYNSHNHSDKNIVDSFIHIPYSSDNVLSGKYDIITKGREKVEILSITTIKDTLYFVGTIPTERNYLLWEASTGKSNLNCWLDIEKLVKK